MAPNKTRRAARVRSAIEVQRAANLLKIMRLLDVRVGAVTGIVGAAGGLGG